MRKTLLVMAILLSLATLSFVGNVYANGPVFQQINPPYGATVAAPPTFEWGSGPYNLFRVSMMIPMRGIYWRINLPWVPGNLFDMQWLPYYGLIWCNITVGYPVLWYVTGLNTFNWRTQTIGPSIFFKELCEPDCEGRECGDDGCGGSCGECNTGYTCDEETGQCMTEP